MALAVAVGMIGASSGTPARAASAATLSGLRVTGWTSGSVGLAWQAPGSGEGWTYWVRMDGSTPEIEVLTAAGTVTANVPATPGTHTVSVVALGPSGAQASSDRTVSVDTREPFTDSVAPATPAHLRVVAGTVGATTTAIAWDWATDNTGAIRAFETTTDGVSWVKAYGEVRGGLNLGYRFIGLTPGTAYRLAVRTVDAAGNASAPATVDVVTAAAADTSRPSTPTGFRAVRDGGGRVTALTWAASTDNSGQVSYALYYADDPRLGLSAAQFVRPPAGAGPRVDVEQLRSNFVVTPGRSYTVVVRALDPTGNLSAASDILTFTA